VIGQKAVGGLLWAYGTFAWERFGNLIVTIVLARLLIPADFGLFAGAALIVGLIDTFGQMGIREALVYTPEATASTRNTAFFMDLCIGLLQWSVLFFSAPLGVFFIDDARIVPILQILSFAPLINCLSRTHEALLQREFRFARRYMCDISSIVAKTAVAVFCAYAGLGVWSLVLAQIASMTLRTALRWIVTGWRPGLAISRQDADRIFSYGRHIFFISLIALLSQRSHQFLIGGILGPVALGYYFIGTRVPELILSGFGTVLSQIVFPVFARAHENGITLVEAFFAATKYTAYAVVPLALGIVAIAPEVTSFFFGDRWAPAVPLMKIFALVGLMQMLPWVAGDAFKAIGRPDVLTRLALIHIAVAVPLISAFIYFGRDVVLAAVAVLIVSCGSAVLRLWYVSRFLNFSRTAYIDVLGRPLAAGAIMVAGLYGWRASAEPLLSDTGLLATSVALGVFFYTAAVWLVDRPRLREAMHLIRRATTAPATVPIAASPVPRPYAD
jgi:O-antigen/teichoic acid export membrane protein